MAITFIDATDRILHPAASVHKIGRLVFNKDAALFMGLDSVESRTFMLASDSGAEVLTFWLIDPLVCNVIAGHISPPVTLKKTGGRYYHLHRFDWVLHKMGIDHTGKKNLKFEITKTEYEGYEAYVLTLAIATSKKP